MSGRCSPRNLYDQINALFDSISPEFLQLPIGKESRITQESIERLKRRAADDWEKQWKLDTEMQCERVKGAVLPHLKKELPTEDFLQVMPLNKNLYLVETTNHIIEVEIISNKGPFIFRIPLGKTRSFMDGM